MKLKMLTITLLFSFSTSIFSQENETNLTLNLLENDKISEVNIEEEKFIKSIEEINTYFKENFAHFPNSQRIGVFVNIHKIGNPTIELYSNPKIEDNISIKYLNEIKKIKIENTKIVDFSFFISINRKSEDIINDFPSFENQIKSRNKKFENADLKDKLKIIKNYSIYEVLPVLSAYETIVDDKFEGVKYFGKLLERTNFNEKHDIDSLTTFNLDYWRANLEMAAGNQLIPISKIFMLASQGEIDLAKKYIEVISMFSDAKNISNYYLEDLNLKINLFNEILNKEIEKGIIEHDKGEYQKA